MQVMRGSLPLIDAIDLIYSAAVAAGIVARVGDDLVQSVMTAAICEATKRLNRSDEPTGEQAADRNEAAT